MRDTQSIRRYRTAVGALLMALMLAACSQNRSSLDIGLNRVAVDLAFKADADAKASPSKDLRDLPPLPTPIQPTYALTAGNDLVPVDDVPPHLSVRPVRPACPDLEAGAVPEQSVTQTVLAPPVAGTYSMRNDGQLTVSAGTFNTALPYPRDTTVEIRAVSDVTAPPDALGDPGARTITFDVNEPLGDGYTLTTYSVTKDAISLVKRVTHVGATTVTFSPTPAIKLVGLGVGTGDSWNSAGTDLATGTTGVVQGKIVKRETVNVCGTPVDTFRVQSSERYVSLSSSGSYSSSTKDTTTASGSAAPGLPNFYNVATQFGGIFVQVETHTSTTVAPYVIDIDNIGTMNSIRPNR